MSKRLTTEEFIEKSKYKHGDRYDYSKVEYVNNQTKVCIICPTHGSFYQKPKEHMIGRGCPQCGLRKIGEHKRIGLDGFIEKSKMYWGEGRFDYSKVVYLNTDKPVTLTCLIHNVEYKQTPYRHLKGYNGCHYCCEEKYDRKKVGYWTYERCVEKSKEYEWVIDFKLENQGCYNRALKMGWLKDFVWLKRNYEQDECILTAKKHLIYGYFFPEFNSVYIGLTVNLPKRHKQHQSGGSVYKFCKNYNIEVLEPVIIEENLSLFDVREREFYWIEYYKSLGYNILNRTKGGDSVGRLCVIKKVRT